MTRERQPMSPAQSSGSVLMEPLIVLLICGILVILVTPFVALAKSLRAKEQADTLHSRLDVLEKEVWRLRRTLDAAAEAPRE